MKLMVTYFFLSNHSACAGLLLKHQETAYESNLKPFHNERFRGKKHALLLSEFGSTYLSSGLTILGLFILVVVFK